MKLSCRWILLLLPLLFPLPGGGQSLNSYRGVMTPGLKSDKLDLPQHLKDYEHDGKLTLGLEDAVVLALENNSSVRIQEFQVEGDKFSLLSQYQPFDPLLTGLVNINRYSYSGYTELQGVGNSSNSTFNSLSQSAQINYIQTFATGTNINVGLTTARNSNNSSFYYFNPYVNSVVNLQFTQPLLRNAGRFANTAGLVIARRTLQQSGAAFGAQVSDAVLQVVNQYWSVVQAHGNLDVQRRSMDLADTSYQHDKRALELGALPPLDIYRSESELAARRLQMIQSQYALTQDEEALRLTIGANQDAHFRTLPLELTEKPEPQGEPANVDMETALQEALARRPEIQETSYALANDETGISLAKNRLKPDIELNGFYQSSGLGGNQYNLNTGQLISSGGLGSSYGQLFGFGFPGYGGTLSLNLPIKNRAGQAVLGTALVGRRRDLYAARQTREVITNEVSNAVHQLEEAKLTLVAGKASLDLARKSLAAEQRKYELGAQTNFFVLDAQTRLADAELQVLQTQITYQIARASVDHATGNILEPYHVQIAELTK